MKCFDLMVITQLANQKENFDICTTKSRKMSRKTFHTKTLNCVNLSIVIYPSTGIQSIAV